MGLNHLIFYDGECGLCDHMVQFVLKHDTKKRFLFAPLQGTTAASRLHQLMEQLKGTDSLVLIEHFQTPHEKIYIRGKAVFRILWLLGNPWRPFGLFYFLPPACYDWAYRWIAHHRQKIFSLSCTLPSETFKDRFLP